MIVRRKDELEMLREGGRRLAAILREVQKAAAPGVSTAELDRLAGRLIADAGGAPVFKGYRSRAGERPYPASICTSVNDEVVHAIPHEDQLLRNGDILGIDIGMRYPAADGLVTDAAVTVPVGKVPPRAAKLIAAARRALEVGVAVLAPGIRLGDLGAAIQGEIERDGFGVVRELVGHGVGKRLHEDPYVPNYGRPGEGRAIPEGMVLAIEPMAVLGDPAVKLDADGWTWRTKDGSLAAHFEHTVIVTKERAEVLTRE